MPTDALTLILAALEIAEQSPDEDSAYAAIEELGNVNVSDFPTPPTVSKTLPRVINPPRLMKSLYWLTKEFVRKPDKNGMDRCYDNGRRVSCGDAKKPATPRTPKPKPVETPGGVATAPAKKPRAPRKPAAPKPVKPPKVPAAKKPPKVDASQAILDELTGYIQQGTLEQGDMEQVAQLLSQVTLPQMKAIKQKLGLGGKASLKKADLAQAMATEAIKASLTNAPKPFEPDEGVDLGDEVDEPIEELTEEGLDLGEEQGQEEQPKGKWTPARKSTGVELAEVQKEIRSRMMNDPVVSIADLRDEMPENMQGKEFDEAVLKLIDDEVLIGSQDAYPEAVPEDRRGRMLEDGATLFTTLMPRNPEEFRNDQTEGISKPPKPNFTGIDSLGREWRNGELVAAQEEPMVESTSSKEAVPLPEGYKVSPQPTPGGLRIARNNDGERHTLINPRPEAVQKLARGLEYALENAPLYKDAEDGIIPISLLKTLIRRKQPEATEQEMADALMYLAKVGGDAFQPNTLNETQKLKNPDEDVIWDRGRAKGYFTFDGRVKSPGQLIADASKSVSQLQTPQATSQPVSQPEKTPEVVPPKVPKRGTAKEKPVAGEKAPKPPEPGFTGIDSQGRAWVDGELVPADEEDIPSDQLPGYDDGLPDAKKLKPYKIDLMSMTDLPDYEYLKGERAFAGGEIPPPQDEWDADDIGTVMVNLRDTGRNEELMKMLQHYGLTQEVLNKFGGTGNAAKRATRVLVLMGKRLKSPVPIPSLLKSKPALRRKVAELAGVGREQEAITEKVRSLAREQEGMRERSADIDRILAEDATKPKAQRMPAKQRNGMRVESARLIESAWKTDDQMRAMSKEQEKLKEGTREKIRQLLALSPDKATPFMVKEFPQGTSKEEIGAVRSAQAFLENLVARDPTGKEIPPYHVTRETTGRWANRAYYNIVSHSLNVHAGLTEVSTNVHELAHALEAHYSGVQEATREFLEYRVGDEKPQKMAELFPDHGYNDDEYGRKDHFDKFFKGSSAYYVGKEPGALVGSEVISMGVEALYKDAAGFAKADPEYCTFILGILDGSLRK